MHPNIPKPLHGTVPRQILGEDWWNEQRQIAYAKNDYRCWACGVHKSKAKYHNWLEAHEMYDINYVVGTIEFIEIVALCHSCHNYIHSGRMAMLVDEGKMSHEKYKDILKHGDNILKKANLETPSCNGPIAEWGKWRLVLNGKKHKGKFKTFDEWRNHYTR